MKTPVTYAVQSLMALPKCPNVMSALS